jgi:hypothetical protein
MLAVAPRAVARDQNAAITHGKRKAHAALPAGEDDDRLQELRGAHRAGRRHQRDEEMLQ